MTTASKRPSTASTIATYCETNGISPEQAISILSRVRVVDPSEYRPASRNHNQGSERGSAAIDQSFRSYGVNRGIAVANNREAFCGSHALQSAIDTQAATEIIEVDVSGSSLVASRRIDIPDGADKLAIAAALADNLSHEHNFRIEPVQLKADLEFLSQVRFDMPKVILSPIDIENFLMPLPTEPEQEEEKSPGTGNKEINCQCPNCGTEFIRQL